jgi:hypothetical protein
MSRNLRDWRHAAKRSAAREKMEKRDRLSKGASEARPIPSMPKMPWDDEKKSESDDRSRRR